jgi:hypothetical protein
VQVLNAQREGKAMNNKILVPLKKHDRVAEIVPFIEKVAQPGATVMFLVRRPVNGLKWLQAYSAISQCGVDNALVVARMAQSYSTRMRAQLATQQVFNTCAALQRMGVKVGVETYAGSLKETLRSYGVSEDSLVLMRPGMLERIASFLEGTASMRGIFRRPFSHSVILQHSGG